jgi:hypothetical protein
MPEFLIQHQLLLWILTVFTDLGFAVLCYRLFGRTGLYGVIDTPFIYLACRWKAREPDWKEESA